jgi:hypothetical protein
MSVKIPFAAAPVLAGLLCCVAQGQAPPEMARPDPPPAYVTAPADEAPGVEGPPAYQGPPTLDDWMTYRRPGSCYCPIGGNGPIQTELYVRAGPEFIVGGGTYGHTLGPGWQIQGGGRVLFFDPSRTSAWALDLGLVNSYNRARRQDVQIPITVIVPGPFGSQEMSFGTNGVPGVTIAVLNRTYANLGLGKEWWVGLSASDPGRKLRWGVDGGARYGSEKGEFNEIHHRTDTIAAAYAALHADLEYTCGCCCTFSVGVRAEYSYTWSDILQSLNNSDVQDVTVLLTLGVRF